MDRAPVEKCLECHLPKSQDGVYSLTQWISVCSCDLVIDDDQRETVDFCSICNKRVLKARKGSFTQWIFRSDLCSCENPKIVARKNQAEEGQDPEFFEDASQEEIEISLDEDQFPTDRFKPIGILGEGTSGNVYLCRDRVLNKKVAVKCLRYLSNHALVSFQKEAKINTKLEHPNIAKVIDFGIYENEKPYMVVEYIDGLSLDHHLEAHGTPDIKIALEILIQVCDAVSYAHKHSIFHRDIKLANVLFLDKSDVGPKISVIDFGLAQMKASPDADKDQNAVIGTPGYMAPDSFQGLEYNEQSEVYSIGCLAFELLTGRLPFIAESTLDVLSKHANERPPGLSEVSEDLTFTEDLERVISKCLEKNQTDRYHSASDLADEFKTILDEGLFSLDETISLKAQNLSGISKVLRRLKAVSLFLVPLLVALLVGNYYYSNFVKNKISHNELVLQEEKELVSPKTDMEKKLEYVIIASEPQFSPKEGFMHPDNVLGFEDEDMKFLVGKNYDSISFYGASVSGAGLKYLVNEPIERLSLDYTSVQDDAFKYVNKMKKLKVISCEYVGVTDKAIEQLVDLKELRIITLNGDRNITDKSAIFLAKNYPDLVKFSFLGTKVTDTGLVKFKNSKHLQEIYLNNTKIGDKSVRAICKPPLSVLLLSGTNITDKSLEVIADCPSIKEIALTGCKLISNRGILKLRKRRPRLRINTKERYDNFSFDLLNADYK